MVSAGNHMLLLVLMGENQGKNVTHARFFSINHFGSIFLTPSKPKIIGLSVAFCNSGFRRME